MTVVTIEPHSPLAQDTRLLFAQLGSIVGAINVANGWDTSRGMIADPDAYDPRWVTAHKIAELGLIGTEVAEAIEEVRHGHEMPELYFTGGRDMAGLTIRPSDQVADFHGVLRKPEGVPSELADVLIRVFDIADAYSIDLADALIAKLNHNATRGLHHGGKAL